MSKSDELIKMADEFGAHNYKPLPVVIEHGQGVWVTDVEGKKYIDMLSAYSAINHGHRHPKIVKALHDQTNKLTLTSRAFHNDVLPKFLKKLCEATHMEMVLPMNSGAEAVETAIKTARKWGYKVKGVEPDKAEIIVCDKNFHGRTTTIISFSTDPQCKEDFGPFTPGFKVIPHGDKTALEKAITKNTVAFLVEPIQGEAGIFVPYEGYLEDVKNICKKNNVLFILDEIQTGFCRTGKFFAYQYENAKPDLLIMGKALGGGILPVSAVAASKNILGVFKPGDHGSTFGGNPLASAVGIASLEVLQDEHLDLKSFEMGQYFKEALIKSLPASKIKEVRGKGLLIGLEIKKEAGMAREYCYKMKDLGVLCKETHETIIRFAPPLVITKEEIDWAIDKIVKAFN